MSTQNKKTVKRKNRNHKGKNGKNKILKQIMVDIPNPLGYFGLFAGSILYWEILMCIQTGGIKASSLFLLFFVPAQGLFVTAFCGFGKRKDKINYLNRILVPVLMMLLGAFYIAQLIYVRNFGSLFSISMMGMGNDAMGNFWWALKDTVRGAIGWIILFLLPVLLAIVLSAINKPIKRNYHHALHGICLVLAIILWFAGVLGIRLFGNGRQTPYYLFTNPSVSTDAAASKLGVMTTALVESGAYYFGFEHSEGGLVEEVHVDTSVYEVVNVDTTEEEEEAIDPEEEEVIREPWINEKIDFAKLASTTQDAELGELDRYFASREPSYTNEYTGLFEGYNLIYICAESFWNYGCNEQVTPTLYKMANNGIVLNNYYNSFYNTTTNGEFAFATSMWPDSSRYAAAGTDVGSFPRSASVYMPQGLGDLFSAQGINSYAFHNYYGKYYRRILSWPNLGYKCKFTGDGMTFSTNWPASDLELIEQSVDDYINDNQFHAYYMTFSGHGPYTNSNVMYQKNIGDVTQITGTDRYNDMARGYLAGELELDRAMEYLLGRLEEAGKLENTVIVIAGDHYPYYLDAEGRTSLVGYEMDEDFEIYRSNCIIYNAGLMEPIMSDTYCCNVDIAPTILNLFNIPYDSRMMIGRDVFSDSVHKATLSNKSFVTDVVKYNYDKDQAEWTEASSQMTETQKNQYLDQMIAQVENEYTVSCKIITDNYFLHVYEDLGLMSSEEVQEERNREAKAASDDAVYNAEDEAKEAERAAKKAEEEAAKAAQEAEAANQAEGENGANPENNEGGAEPVNNTTGNGETVPPAE